MPPPPSATKTARSENPTPKATTSPANSELERSELSKNQPQIPLLDSLNDFAQSIMSAASLTVRRDLTKQQAVGQQKERDRQSKFKSTFLTLIEDSELRVESVEKVSKGIEKQIGLSSQAQSTIANTLAVQLQKVDVSDAPLSARDRGSFKDDLADLKADLKAAGKDITHLNREAVMLDELHKKLRGLATKNDLWEIITKDKLRRVTTDEVRKHVTEALVPTEKKLASLIVEDANLNQRMKGVEAVTRKHHETARDKNQQQPPRDDRLDTSLNDIKMKLSQLELIVQEQERGYATVKVDLGAQDKVLTDLNNYVRRDPSNDDLSLDKLVMNNSNQIHLLQQDYEKLNEAVRQAQDLQAASIIESSPQISKVSRMADSENEKEFQRIRSDLDALKLEQQELRLIRHDLDALKLDREKVVLIRTDLDTLIDEEKLKDMDVANGFEAIEGQLNKKDEDLARLQNAIMLVQQSQASQTVPNHPPTPPFASVSTSPRESDEQKLQDVEIGLRKLTKTTQGLELFVNSQQQKFDGLNSDRIVQSMVHQMQQMYPQHPGNLVALVKESVARQARVDSYLSGNLKDRLVNIESQIAARADKDSKIEEIAKFTAENRTTTLATTNSLKLDIEGLRHVAFTKLSEDPIDYGNRIDKLADRVTAVEARYVKAIGEFQTSQADLVRDVTHLQFRNRVGSSRNTPRQRTTMSRSSKSAEPNGTTVSFENVNDSDSSDTPLSQRADRRVDRIVRGPLDPNLKRKAIDADDEDEDEGVEAGPTNAKKVAKRKNVSGRNPFS